MNKDTKYNAGEWDHDTLKTYIMEMNPHLIHPDFEPIKKNLMILRGRLDIFGKVRDKYCLVVIKIDKQGGLKAFARRQLERYSTAINEYLSWFSSKEHDFCFGIVRHRNGNLYTDFYENITELKGEKYENGKGYGGSNEQ